MNVTSNKINLVHEGSFGVDQCNLNLKEMTFNNKEHQKNNNNDVSMNNSNIFNESIEKDKLDEKLTFGNTKVTIDKIII
jgi:hypothetical protein